MLKQTNSIIFKVTLLFIFSSICFVFFVIYFVAMEKYQNDSAVEQKYNAIIYTLDSAIQNGSDISDIKAHLLSIGFSEINDGEILNLAAQNQFLLYGLNSTISINSKKILGHYYIIIHNVLTRQNFAFSDYKDINYANYYSIAVFAFVTLIFFYILVINSLLPLISLRKEVHKFSNGDMNIKTVANNNDEIGKLSEEFTKAAKKINEVNNSRILFLRAIMHELKTPITKGRLISEMLENGKLKTRLDSIFTRLNDIINDLSRLEELSTKNYKITKNTFRLTDLMQNINKMLIIEDERPRNVILEHRNAIIESDFELMSLCVKNLLDNATKHSSDKKARIFVKDNDLVISNLGKPFKNSIEPYFQPFYNDGEENSARGLGLGLYIIKNTIEAQGFELFYEYKNGRHNFYIKNCIIRDFKDKK